MLRGALACRCHATIEQTRERPGFDGTRPRRQRLSLSHHFSRLMRRKMQMLGVMAFGAITVVNLIVLGLVLAGLFRRVRAHH
jgi:hypothetical protein